MLFSLHAGLILAALTTATSPPDPLPRLPLAFVQNEGQWDARVRYVVRRAGMTAFLTDDGLRLELLRREGTAGLPDDRPDDRVQGVNVFLGFEGVAADVRVAGRGEFPGRRSYLLGDDRTAWKSDVPAFAAVRYGGLADGVDLEVREREGRLEYDLLLAPGADPGRVAIRCEGIDGLEIESDGTLVMRTAIGVVRQSPPVSWHVLPTGETSPVASRFRLLGDRRYGFEVDGIDPSQELVIDPGLEWSTLLGGPTFDAVQHFETDDAGLVTVAGWTRSSTFPTTAGAFDTTHNSTLTATDVFVARLDPSQVGAAQLLWSTFLGGAGEEFPNALALGAGGLVYIGGRTSSANFPTTAGAYATTKSGDRDAFVALLDPSQSGSAQLVWSTFLGGSGRDHGVPLAVDGAGVVTVAGWTRSVDFPITAGALDATWNGGVDLGDAFVARLDPGQVGAAQLVYSTFLGDTGEELIRALSLTAGGDVIVAGTTSSTAFPTTAGAWDTTHNGGGDDAFVARIDPSQVVPAQQLVWSTFVGGSGLDQVNAMAIDETERATVGGWTGSTDLPVSVGAFDPTWNGGCAASPPEYDAFVARLDPTGSALLYSTYLGGTCNEGINGLAVDSGMVTVTGSVSSFDFPSTAGAFDTTHNGGGGQFGPFDAFVTRLDPERVGSDQLLYSTFLGGAGSYDFGYYSLAIDGEGAATVAGLSRSSDFPTTAGAYDTVNSSEDGFVTRLDMLPVGAEKRGLSTPGCDGPLAIGVAGMPQIGNASFGFTCTRAPAGAAGFLFLGVSCLPNPVFGAGAALYFDVNNPFLQLPVGSDAEGVARVPAPLPPNSSLVGLGACAQFAWPDSCAPGGYSASNALEVTVQP